MTSTPSDGWTERVTSFGTVTYEHRDDSLIASNEGYDCRSKPWALFVSDPPTMWDSYETPELAMAVHAEGEWREHMRSEP